MINQFDDGTSLRLLYRSETDTPPPSGPKTSTTFSDPVLYSSPSAIPYHEQLKAQPLGDVSSPINCITQELLNGHLYTSPTMQRTFL